MVRDVPQLEELGLEEAQRELGRFLSEEEQARLGKRKGQIAEWLAKRMDIGDGHSPHALTPRGWSPLRLRLPR